MTKIRYSLICIILAVAGMLGGCAGQKKQGEGCCWIKLFNGKDLDGWTVKIAGYEVGDNHGDLFRVEDGLLKVSYD